MKLLRFLLFLVLAGLPPAAEASGERKGREVPRLPRRAATAPLGGLASPLNPAAAAKPAPSAPSPSAAALSAPTGEGGPQARDPAAAQARSGAIPFDEPDYFLKELAKLGVPSETAELLRAYLDEPKRHPGDQGKVYHGRRHSGDVPNGIAAVLAAIPPGSVDRPTSVALILAAALHDVDPERPSETPARVSATLPYLASHPDSRRLFEKFGEALGMPAETLRRIVSLYIKRTDFSADASVREQIARDFEAMLAELYPDPQKQEEARKRAELLAFVDKAVTYLRADPKDAEAQVENLAREFRKGIEAGTLDPKTPIPTADGTYAFLDNFLVKSPYYAMLPKDLVGRFQTVLAHFKVRQAAPASADADPAAPSQAPSAATKALENAKQDAAALSGPEKDATAAAKPQGQPKPLPLSRDEIDRRLAGLKSDGFAVIPGDALMDEEAERLIMAQRHVAAVLEQFPKGDGNARLNVFLDHAWLASQKIPDGWNTDILRQLDARGGIKAFVERLTAHLRRILPEEELGPNLVQLRWTRDAEPGGLNPHVDGGGSLTATYAFAKAPGTVLYRVERGGVEELRPPPGSVVIISNNEREQLTGIPATVHSAPRGKTDDRVLLIVHFKSRRFQSHEVDPAVSKSTTERSERVRRHLHRLQTKTRPGEEPPAE